MIVRVLVRCACRLTIAGAVAGIAALAIGAA
jgi:hypothetical protein